MYLPVSRKLSVLSVSLCKKKKPTHTHTKKHHTHKTKKQKKTMHNNVGILS